MHDCHFPGNIWKSRILSYTIE